MKLSKNTLKIISNFAGINKGMLFRQGRQLSTIAETKTMVGYAQIEEEIPTEFAIYDISKFLSILSTFSDPELKIEEQFVVISDGDKRKNYKYRRCALNAILYPESTDVEFGEPVADFVLSATDFANITKITSISKHPEVMFSGDCGDLLIQAHDEKGGITDIYSNVMGQTNTTFKTRIKMESFNTLMAVDYNVSIYENACKFESGNLKYFIGAESER